MVIDEDVTALMTEIKPQRASFFMMTPLPGSQDHKKMVEALKKNDRVRTIGGIYGTVIDVKEDEVTLKIDESSNTKIRVTPGAIGSVLSDEVK